MSTVEYPSAAAIPDGVWRWPHIDPKREWACKGTGRIVIVPEFLDRFEALRERVGFALPIASGYRSPEYNVKVSTTGPDGPHTTAMAVDIRVHTAQAIAVFDAAVELGYLGFGLKQHGPHAIRFIHLDTARDAQALWTYPA